MLKRDGKNSRVKTHQVLVYFSMKYFFTRVRKMDSDEMHFKSEGKLFHSFIAEKEKLSWARDIGRVTEKLQETLPRVE